MIVHVVDLFNGMITRYSVVCKIPHHTLSAHDKHIHEYQVTKQKQRVDGNRCFKKLSPSRFLFEKSSSLAWRSDIERFHRCSELDVQLATAKRFSKVRCLCFCASCCCFASDAHLKTLKKHVIPVTVDTQFIKYIFSTCTCTVYDYSV